MFSQKKPKKKKKNLLNGGPLGSQNKTISWWSGIFNERLSRSHSHKTVILPTNESL